MAVFKRHPAPPILALHHSFRFDPERPDLEDLPIPHRVPEPRYLATSCSSIDGALGGGLSYGQINSLSADSVTASAERTLVAMHAVVTHLLFHAEAQVAWVDTEGQFSPALMKEVASLRLRDQETKMSVEGILDRVQIIRVFDIHGIVEVVDELKQAFKDKDAEKAMAGLGVNDRKEGEEVAGDHNSIDVVVIDTIAQPLLELMNVEPEDEWIEHNEKPEAAGLFVSLSRSLSLLAKERDMCVLFLNTTRYTPHDGDPFSRWNEMLPSAFAAMEERPALGPVYAECVDLSVMISKYPYNPGDTEGSASVIEVLGDRNGPRTGGFGAFVVDGMKLVDISGSDTEGDDALARVFEEAPLPLRTTGLSREVY